MFTFEEQTEIYMKALENIIAEYLANKSPEELKEVLKDLDKAMLDALAEDKARCDKMLGLAQNTDFLNNSSKTVYNKLRG